MSPTVPAKPSHPLDNPSYPDRTHFHEREGLVAKLKERDRVLEECRRKVSVVSDPESKASHERSLHQLLGARDQIAEMVSRIPGEVGHLYEEDKHRFEEAIAAFDRVARRFGTTG